jgi:hypothetical protein
MNKYVIVDELLDLAKPDARVEECVANIGQGLRGNRNTNRHHGAGFQKGDIVIQRSL